MKPYYEHAGIRIFHGDAREVVADLGEFESVITDPVWPNSIFPDVSNPQKLLGDVLNLVLAKRIVVQLGCDSDPRFTSAIPERFKFVRVCVLDYAQPSYKGRIVYGGDVAYVFGEIPTTGRHLIPGLCISTRSDGLFRRSNWNGPEKKFNRDADNTAKLPHPAPRRLQHVEWLCKWFAGSSVLDPFMGSGTTAVACKSLRVPFTGIEIEERFCELATKRLAQELLFPADEPTCEATA